MLSKSKIKYIARKKVTKLINDAKERENNKNNKKALKAG